MSDEQYTPPVESLINLDINKADIIAIGMVRHEEKLRLEEEACRAALLAEQACRRECDKALCVALEAVVQAAVDGDPSIQAFIDATAAADLGTVKVMTSANYREKEDMVTYTVRMDIKPLKGSETSKTRIARPAVEVEPPDSVRTSLKSIEESDSRLAELSEEFGRINAAMSPSALVSKEREMRAHLAMNALKTTGAGQALLESMAGSSSPFLLTTGDIKPIDVESE